MKRFRRPLMALCFVATCLGLWAFVIEPSLLTTRTYRLPIPHWNAGLAGLRVVVLADLHIGSPYNGMDKLRRIVELTNAMKPDLVIIPGDLVIQDVFGGSFVPPEEAAQMLSRLQAPLGVYASMGNHDYWLNAPRVMAALEEQHITVLQDETVRVRRGDVNFWVAGISDYWEGPHDVKKALAEVKDDAPVLMFTHNPDIFPDVPARVSLLIAGHTHGGQVHLPFLGHPVVPSSYGERYVQGHIIEQGRHVFVSSGLGTSIFPVRFRVPPEITVLELFPQ